MDARASRVARAQGARRPYAASHSDGFHDSAVDALPKWVRQSLDRPAFSVRCALDDRYSRDNVCLRELLEAVTNDTSLKPRDLVWVSADKTRTAGPPVPLLAVLSGEHPLVGLDVVFKTSTCTLPAKVSLGGASPLLACVRAQSLCGALTQEMGATVAVMQLQVQAACLEGELLEASRLLQFLGDKRPHYTCCLANEASRSILGGLTPHMAAAQTDARMRPVDTSAAVGMIPRAVARHALTCCTKFAHCSQCIFFACQLFAVLCILGHREACEGGAEAVLSICPILNVDDYLYNADDSDWESMVVSVTLCIQAMMALCGVQACPSRPHVGDDAGSWRHDTSGPCGENARLLHDGGACAKLLVLVDTLHSVPPQVNERAFGSGSALGNNAFQVVRNAYRLMRALLLSDPMDGAVGAEMSPCTEATVDFALYLLDKHPDDVTLQHHTLVYILLPLAGRELTPAGKPWNSCECVQCMPPRARGHAAKVLALLHRQGALPRILGAMARFPQCVRPAARLLAWLCQGDAAAGTLIGKEALGPLGKTFLVHMKLFSQLWVNDMSTQHLQVQEAEQIARQPPVVATMKIAFLALDLQRDADDFEDLASNTGGDGPRALTNFSDSGDDARPLEDLDPWARSWGVAAGSHTTEAELLGSAEFPLVRVVARAICAITQLPNVQHALSALFQHFPSEVPEWTVWPNRLPTPRDMAGYADLTAGRPQVRPGTHAPRAKKQHAAAAPPPPGPDIEQRREAAERAAAELLREEEAEAMKKSAAATKKQRSKAGSKKKGAPAAASAPVAAPPAGGREAPDGDDDNDGAAAAPQEDDSALAQALQRTAAGVAIDTRSLLEAARPSLPQPAPPQQPPSMVAVLTAVTAPAAAQQEAAATPLVTSPPPGEGATAADAAYAITQLFPWMQLDSPGVPQPAAPAGVAQHGGDDGDDRLCVCCLDSPRTTVLGRGCAHPPVLCTPCASVIMATAAPQCPVCRAPA